MSYKAVVLMLGCLALPHAIAGQNIIRINAPIDGAPSTGAPHLDLHESNLAEGVQGADYSFNLSQAAYWIVPPKGQLPALTWSAAAPTGLSLSSDGLLSGIPNNAGLFAVPVTVQAAGLSATRTYTLSIKAPVVAHFELLDAQLPQAQNGSGFTYDFSTLAQWVVPPADGDEHSFAWSAIVPAGLSMSSEGVLSGTPKTSGSFSVAVTATGAGKSVTHNYTLNIKGLDAQLELADATLSTGTTYRSYSYDLTPLAQWKVAPQPGDPKALAWSLSSAPPGLNLSASGLLTGMPTAQGEYSVDVTVTAGNKTATHTYPLKIAVPQTLMCKDIKASAPSFPSGVYTLSVNGAQLNAYCDMATDGGGWTLIGRGAPNAVGSWTASSNDYNLSASPQPDSVASFKYSDAAINAMPKSAYKVVTSNNNTARYFKPSCVYNHLATASGDCAISYASESWTAPRGNGLSSEGVAGLSDNRASVAYDVYYLITSMLSSPDDGWASGNGTNYSNLGTGINGAVTGLNMWVR